MAVLLALFASVAWGTGDFLGGLASRRAAALTVVLTTESVGVIVVLGLAFFVDGDPTARDLLLGAAAGLAGVAGLTMLFRGLSIGRASVVAPVSAVGSALIQVTWGLLHGEHPGGLALVGIVLALGAIGIVAGAATEGEATHHGRRAHELGYGLGAAVGFGLFLVIISETSDAAGLWPLVTARLAPIAALLILLPILRKPLLVPRSVLPHAAAAGIADGAATVLLLVALRAGIITLVAPAANLYPAVTVLLARAIQHERIGRGPAIGLAVALVSIVLIAV